MKIYYNMANLLNKLVYIKKTYQKSIVFIEDEGILWTHGKEFGLSATDLEALTDRIDTLEGLRWFDGIAEIGEGKSIFKAADGATTIKFGGDSLGIVTVTIDADGVHVSGKEVTAEGDDYVSATASTNGDNKVTVEANVVKMELGR